MTTDAPSRPCRRCNLPTGRPTSAAYCDRCRPIAKAKQTDWPHTPETDEIIRAAWAGDKYRCGAWREVRRRGVLFPKGVICRRAQVIGASRERVKTFRQWTPAEDAIVIENARLRPHSILQLLKAAGFDNRTASAVFNRRKALGGMAALRGALYSTIDTGAVLGCDARTVLRWIDMGLIEAIRERNTSREGAQAAPVVRARWILTRRALRRFIFDHPELVDLGRADKLSFLHVLADGQPIGQPAPDPVWRQPASPQHPEGDARRGRETEGLAPRLRPPTTKE